ncbi:hypothetical protein BGZ90_002767 [Linnemannia elongata]|nr:hypothetical protein BGZ90_002767 [Linnemannia elongata]
MGYSQNKYKSHEQQQQQSQEQLQTGRQKKWSNKIKSLIKRPMSWFRSSQSSPVELDTTTATSLSNPSSGAERDTRSPKLRIETQLREGRVDPESSPTGVTDREQSKLYPSLSEYLSTEVDQLYSHEELSAAMTPAKIEQRMRLRRELRDSLRGIPIPPQAEESSKSAARDINVQSANTGIEGVYTNVPLSPGEISIIMSKRRQPTATNPGDLRKLEECLPDVHASVNQLPRRQRPRKNSISQGTQTATAESPFERELEQTSVATAASLTHVRRKRRHGQRGAYRSCPKCELPVTVKSGKRKTNRLPTPEPEDLPVGQSSQVPEEQPKKRRNIRVIPGRFSALDSSDEEEDQREFDRKQAQRRFKGRKLYKARVDEVMEWTHDKDWKPASLETWRCSACDQRTRKTEIKCKFCNSPRPAPLAINTTRISVLRAMEQKCSKTKEPSIVSVPVLTSSLAASSPSFTAPISAATAPTFISATLAALLPPSSHAGTGCSFSSSPYISTSATTGPTSTTASVTTTAPMFPQPTQRIFQFGGFSSPKPFSFSVPTQTTTTSVTNLSTSANVLGLPNTAATTTPPATSMVPASLSFNPFAAASAAITGRCTSTGTPSITAITILSSPQSVGMGSFTTLTMPPAGGPQMSRFGSGTSGMQGLTGPGTSAGGSGLNGGIAFTAGPGSSSMTGSKRNPPPRARKLYGRQTGRKRSEGTR